MVFVNDRLRKEIAAYLKTIPVGDPNRPLFMTQNRSAFIANVLCQTLNGLYRHVGMNGATRPLRSTELHCHAGQQGGTRGRSTETLPRWKPTLPRVLPQR